MSDAAVAMPEDEKTIFGHPKGLYVLFFAEMWERFCFYGMRALLALHIAKVFFAGDGAQRAASESYGGFTALIYAVAIFGGAIADRVLGYRRSIVLGGLIMAAGEFMLMSGQKTVFFMGLAALIVGNGLFKPNISTLVGKLYKQGDPRRDGGFTIFYMGINVGATLAPIFCQMIAEKMGGYQYGFMLAGAGMLLGCLCFGLGTKHLQGQGVPPPARLGSKWILMVLAGAALVVPIVYSLLSLSHETVGIILDVVFGLMILFLAWIAMKEETQVRQRMFVLLLLLVVNSVFWMGFEQAGNALNFFATKKLIPLQIGDWQMPGEWWQSVNAVLIVALGPIFASLWVRLAKRNIEPVIPRKFGFGVLGMGLGFAVLNLGINHADADGRVLWYWLFALYFVHTMAELCISPVGLSMVTKLAPPKITGMVMGAWFISIATGNFYASDISSSAADKAEAAATGLLQAHGYADAFVTVIYMGVGVGVALIIMSTFINKWMHGVK